MFLNGELNNEKLEVQPIVKYKIVRESKIIKFEDVNEIEEETTYLIEIKKEIKSGEKYSLEIPFTYFRIPEDLRSKKLLELMDKESDALTEKIIWFYIFEVIYGNKEDNVDWSVIRQNLIDKLKEKDVLKDSKREKDWEEVKILSEEEKEQIKRIEIRKFVESESNLKEILNYPNTVRMYRFSHILDPYGEFRFPAFGFLILFLFWILLLIVGFINEIILGFILALILFSFSMFFFFFYYFLIRNSLMKKGRLRIKLDESIVKLIQNFHDLPKKERFDKLKYLDKHSDDLFSTIYNTLNFELEKAIINYKSFNPILLKILFDNNEILPEKTSEKGFFHKTAITIDFNNIPIKENYSLKIIAKRIIGESRKSKKIIQKKWHFLNIKSKKFYIIVIFLFIANLISFSISPFIWISVILLGLLGIFILLFLVINFEWQYVYYSPLQEPSKEVTLTSRLYHFKFFNANKKIIYSIPSTLRNHCSYYYLIYAPRFHNIEIVSDLLDIIKRLERPLDLRKTFDISKDILSFHLPRSSNVNRIDFDLDFDIPIKTRIIVWYIGLSSLLYVLLGTSIYYLVSLFNPKISIDLTILGLTLTFLILLMGIFGREFLEKPTKDLQKKSKNLITLIISVGILFSFCLVLTILINLFF